MFGRLIAFPLVVALLISSSAFSQNERRTKDIFLVKLFEPAGEGWRSTDVTLNFERDRIVLRIPKDDSQAGSIGYSEINRAEYSHSKSHRKVSPATAIVGNVFVLPLILRGVDTHWLTVQSGTSQTFLNLDKENYQAVLTAFETNVGKKVTGWNVETAAR